MKFKIKLNVVSDKTGIDLHQEYVRLGFHKMEFPKMPEKFPTMTITVDVSREFVLNYEELFQETLCPNVTVSTERLGPKDFEDWGSVGPVLSKSSLDENFLAAILTY